MIPHIFISSTVADLLHLRDALRDTVADMGYNPVLSEHGGIGFVPSTSAEDSCYLTVKQCHAAVVIIAKRYGHIGQAGIAVTHNEFRTARSEGIPIFCLVERELLAFKAVYEAQSLGAAVVFPGMDNAPLTFAFVKEVMEGTTNNAILPFSNVTDARSQLKNQFAHLFAELLRQRFDPVISDVRDALSEIKTLRHELISAKQTSVDHSFLRGVRALLDDRFSNYRDLLQALFPTMEQGLEGVLSSGSFDEFVARATGSNPIEESTESLLARLTGPEEPRLHASAMARWPLPNDFNEVLHYSVGEKVRLNPAALRFFRALHDELRKVVTGRTEIG